VEEIELTEEPKSGCPLPGTLVDVDRYSDDAWKRVLSYCDLIVAKSTEYSLNPKLVSAIIYVESKGLANAVNEDTGASGLMQVIPRDSAYGMSQSWAKSRPTILELHDPVTALDSGCYILSNDFISKYPTFNSALCGYGGSEVNEYGTCDYAYTVTNVLSGME
jgi:hypothetical protein